jgi:hypothetical protein
MASVPIDYVPTLKERSDFLRKAFDTDIFALVDSISELWTLWTCLPQDYLREPGALNVQYVFDALWCAGLSVKEE